MEDRSAQAFMSELHLRPDDPKPARRSTEQHWVLQWDHQDVLWQRV